MSSDVTQRPYINSINPSRLNIPLFQPRELNCLQIQFIFSKQYATSHPSLNVAEIHFHPSYPPSKWGAVAASIRGYLCVFSETGVFTFLTDSLY